MTSGVPNKPKLTAEQSAEIADLRERGWSYGRIAMKFGVSDGAVHYHCLKQGAFSPKTCGPVAYADQQKPVVVAKDGRTQRRFSPEDDAQLQNLALSGKKLREICELTGRAPTSVRMRLMTLALHDEMAAT